MKIREQLYKKFRDFTYRHAYAADYLDSAVATQIKVLREQRNMTQHELAQKLGVKQSQVARMESVNNTGWQIRTLKRVAKAFDLFLVVRFESFGAMLPEIEAFGRSTLERPSFANDPVWAGAQSVERSVIDALAASLGDPGLKNTAQGQVDSSFSPPTGETPLASVA
jgi:transcriptional regulator with XRE-family HTH domain